LATLDLDIAESLWWQILLDCILADEYSYTHPRSITKVYGLT
jgi:hypothetical protein